MKYKLLIFSILTFSTFNLTSLNAQDYASALKVSSCGISLEGIRSFTKEFNARLGVSMFSYNANNVLNNDQLTANGNLKLFSLSALADWFPFENNLRLTGGIVINLNKISMTMTPTKTYNSGNIVYTPAKLGNLVADITFNKVAPYIGIGFDNPTAGSSGFGFTFDLGTFYQGSPKASLTASNLLKPMESESGQLQENIKWFTFYPVLAFGLTYKF